jgi:hypothetical protein
MDKNQIIIDLVKQHYSFSFEYPNGNSSDTSDRCIYFTKTGFKSSLIKMSELNQSHIDLVKSEYGK